MKNGKEGMVREIMMGSPVTLKPEDTLDLANDVISLGRIRHIPVVEDESDFRAQAEEQVGVAQERFDQGRDEEESHHGDFGHQGRGCGSSDGGQKDRLRAGDE